MKSFTNSKIIIFLSLCAMLLMWSCKENVSNPEQVGSQTQKSPNLKSAIANTSISSNVLTVTECSLNGWHRSGAVGALGTITFVDGPSTPPLGLGSVRFSSPDKKFIRLKNNDFAGTRLADITELAFSTYVRQSASVVDNLFVVVQIDVNGDGVVDFPVVFNPVYQTGHYAAGVGPDQGVIQLNQWQTWDLLSGLWWKGPTQDPDNGGALFTLATLISQYPDATIVYQGNDPGSIRLSGSSPVFSGPFIGYADNFRIGKNGVTTIYDFEERATAHAGPDQTVIYGYGSNCTTLSGSATGGVAPYTYSWSTSGGPVSNQSTMQVCSTLTTTYVLTVTDINGCTGADSVTVFVNDVRCGNNLDKVSVCHKGKVICIDARDVPDHLAHGDVLGSCTAH